MLGTVVYFVAVSLRDSVLDVILTRLLLFQWCNCGPAAFWVHVSLHITGNRKALKLSSGQLFDGQPAEGWLQWRCHEPNAHA
eukprot:1151964-Pelagomonas_calceolata.AAC.8